MYRPRPRARNSREGAPSPCRTRWCSVPPEEGVHLERPIAHYFVFELLGAGGMGAVYRARDTRLQRDLALKLLPPARFADASARERLLREARAAAALNHGGICTVYEVGEADGEIYIAMELIKGRPVGELIPAAG